MVRYPLTLNSLGHWVPRSQSLNLSHRRRALLPPPPLPPVSVLTTSPIQPIPLPFLKREKKSFRGIEIPTKPTPPAEGECCQSGCARCTYDVYLEDLELYHEDLADAKAKIMVLGEVRREDWPEELGEMGGGGKGEDPKVVAEREAEKMRAGLDPAVR